MRNMSFMLTQSQILAHEKFVTRRLPKRRPGVAPRILYKPGDQLQPVQQCQGLQKGERVVRMGGPIRVVSVREERLNRMSLDLAYGQAECRLEGFPELTGPQFVEMFCKHNKCKWNALVLRIEFEYVEVATVKAPVPMRRDVFVYISGAMTAKDGYSVEQNIAAGVAVFFELLQLGIPAYCPHLCGLVPEAWTILPHASWIEYDTAVIDRCTHVLMMSRWETSTGARLELAHAEKTRKPIAYSVDALVRMMKDEQANKRDVPALQRADDSTDECTREVLGVQGVSGLQRYA